ncbi:MAG TPA: glucan biosynthesis protein, partial [Beijerinckiaceae bacterium]|nr:glucan biosynthesis protein [Beijerinckiaceae bacterium]
MTGAIATGAFAAGFSSAFSGDGLKLGPGFAFSFDRVKERARDLARAPYLPPQRAAAEVLDQIDYDAHGKIRFRTDLALWADGPSA